MSDYLNRDIVFYRFNKAEKDCHPMRRPPYGKWTRKPLAYRESDVCHPCVTRM